MEDKVKFFVGILSIAAALFAVAAGVFSFVLDIRMMSTKLDDLAVAHASDKTTLGAEHELDLEDLEQAFGDAIRTVREDINAGFLEVNNNLRNARLEFDSRVDRVEDKQESLVIDTAILKEKARDP